MRRATRADRLRAAVLTALVVVAVLAWIAAIVVIGEHDDDAGAIVFCAPLLLPVVFGIYSAFLDHERKGPDRTHR